MHMHATALRVEPAFVDAEGGAAFLAVSVRTFHYLVSSGEIQPVQVPKIRRTVYDVAELRALAERWKARPDARKRRERERGVGVPA